MTLAAPSHGQLNPEGIPFPKLSSPIKLTQNPTTSQSSQRRSQLNKINTSVRSSDIPKLLGARKADIAKWYNIPEGEFDQKCQNDKCVKVDQYGRLFHACEGLALTPEKLKELASQTAKEPVSFDSSIDPESAFELESLPNATKTIYLDFNGHVTKGTFWNTTDKPEIVHPPMDWGIRDSNFTEMEKREIIKIWKQVCEDFSPYEVNVTTKEPPLDYLIQSDTNDDKYGIRVVIGGDGREFLPALYGGIAYVGSFSWNSDTPTFVFGDNLGDNAKYIAEAVSHEVGHTLGLWHDGKTDGTTYYWGDGEWAPIMGVAYGARVGQWSKGEYPLANDKGDDMATMARHIPYKKNTEESPYYNPKLGEPLYGTIHKPNEIDSFILDLEGADTTFKIELPPYFPNTDLWMNLKTWEGENITSHKFYPTNSKTIFLPKGKYMLEVQGSKFIGAGNSSYGSSGEYKLTITQAPPIPAITNATLSKNGDLVTTSNVDISPQDKTTTIKYQWEAATYNAPQNFKKIEGATESYLDVAGKNLLGKYLRATLTPTTGEKENTSFTTTPIKITSTFPTEILAKQWFELSSSLELNKTTQEQKNIIINELSLGNRFGSNQEWIELVTLKETDLRGMCIKTKGPGSLKFKNCPDWAKIPEGTIIVIYNGIDKDPLIGKDAFLPKTERRVIVSSTESSLFEGTWSTLRAPENKIALETGFENARKTTYAKTNTVIDGRTWILDDALIGEDPRDMKDGLKSLRMRNGSIETQDFLEEGINEISFLYSRANFSGDRIGTSPTFQVYYCKSTDPNTWIPIGTEVAVLNDSLLTFKAQVSYDGKYKVRISKVSGTKDKRWNIDNLKITESSTMNFVQLVDNLSAPITELHFGYSQKSPKNGFLLPNTTESFTSSDVSEIENGNNWLTSQWSKTSTTITPGKANSTENLQLLLNLSSELSETLPSYWLENAPNGISIDKTTGRIFGAIAKGGYYQIRIHNSNGVNTQHEIFPLVVKQKFEDYFADNPQIGRDPQGDYNKNGIPNVVEFAIANSAKVETTVSKLSDIHALINKNNGDTMGRGQENDPYVLAITYTKNKVADGIDIIPQWSNDLTSWETNQIQSSVIEDLNDKEKIISWIPIPPAPNPKDYENTDPETEVQIPSHKMFMRLSVIEKTR